jgi:hypothetical protein
MPHIDVSRSWTEQHSQLPNRDSIGGTSTEEDPEFLFDNMSAVVRSAALTEALKYLEVIDPKRDLRPFSIYDDPRAKCVMAAFFYRMMIESNTAALPENNLDVFDLDGSMAQELFRSIIVYRDRIASFQTTNTKQLPEEDPESSNDFLDR